MYIYNHIQRCFLIHSACSMFTFQLESQIDLVFSFRSAWMLQGWHASMQQTQQSWPLRIWLVWRCYVLQLVDLKPLRYETFIEQCFFFGMILLGLSDLNGQLSHFMYMYGAISKCPNFANKNLFATMVFLREDDENGDTLKVVDLASGQEVVELAGHLDHVMCGSISWHIMTVPSCNMACCSCHGFQAANPYKCRVVAGLRSVQKWQSFPGIEMTWLPQRHSVTDSFFLSILIYTYLIYIDEHHEYSYRLAHCRCMCISFDFVIALQRLILNFIHFAIGNGHRHMFPQASGKPGFLSPVPKSVQSESHERKTARLQEVHCAGTSRHWSSSPDICISYTVTSTGW